VTWTCPRCGRTFRLVNQRHACGVGNRDALLEGRPPALADLYGKLEAAVKGFGSVEVVTRNRYALFRTTRIFADLTVMQDALRVAIHLDRKVSSPYFIKIMQGDRRVSHVAKIRTHAELRAIMPFLREAYELAASEEPLDAV
jgi:predicted transport protein